MKFIRRGYSASGTRVSIESSEIDVRDFPIDGSVSGRHVWVYSAEYSSVKDGLKNGSG